MFFSGGGYAQKVGKSIQLLDRKLRKFETWMCVPHASVSGLPEGTYQSENVHDGEPMGLNNDVKDVFSVIREDGELVLKVSGEIYGGLTTKAEYANYHLSMWQKWGDKKWPPRENALRDSGILYHCYGPHAAFWEVWKYCLEFQVQETDLADFIGLGSEADVKGIVKEENGKNRKWYDPTADSYLKPGGLIQASKELDAPHGEWNHLELYVVGDRAIHVVNGQIVNVLENTRKPDGTTLRSGQIQIQSEAAEVYYKEIVLTPISEFPVEIISQVRFEN